jgi:hypothetical protein
VNLKGKSSCYITNLLLAIEYKIKKDNLAPFFVLGGLDIDEYMLISK